MKVLIVEDDRKLARLLTRVLSEQGFTADTCTSGADAVKQAMTGVYDLVLLDWMLPDLDGLAVCRELRATARDLPILMLTARIVISICTASSPVRARPLPQDARGGAIASTRLFSSVR